jgi:hypothetical protein
MDKDLYREFVFRAFGRIEPTESHGFNEKEIYAFLLNQKAYNLGIYLFTQALPQDKNNIITAINNMDSGI